MIGKLRSLAFVFLMGILGQVHCSPTISITSTLTTPMCAGGPSFMIAYNTSSSFTSPDTFFVLLSNSAGVFSPGTSIGYLVSTTSGSISCVIPGNTAAGTSYKILIQSTNPQVESSPISVAQIYAQPSATITPSGPTTFCQGGSVTLTASSNTSYSWSNAQTMQAISVSASGTFAVTVTDANSCTAASSPTTVTVNSLPATPTISAGGPTTFCQGGSVTLTSSAASGYTWTGGSHGQTLNVTTGGSYIVTVTNSNNCSAVSSPASVTVNPAPDATITPGGPTSFCQGGSVILSTSGGTSYKWTGGSTAASITVTTSGSYVVTVTNSSNCSAASSPTVVTVNPLPTPTISAGGPTTFCEGGSVVLTASSGSSYLWSNSGTSQAITVTTGGSYTVTVINGSNCSASSSATVVTVNPKPTITITPSGPTTFCTGGTVNLSATTNTSYHWSNSLTTQAITVSTGGTYSVTVTNAQTCSASSSVTVSVTTNVTPSVSIDEQPASTVCPGKTVTFTATASNAGNPAYQWYLNGSMLAGDTGSTYAYGPALTSDSGSAIKCVITARNVCASPATATSAAETINVSAPPAQPVIKADKDTICAGAQGVSFTLLNDLTGFTYKWSAQNATLTGPNNTPNAIFNFNSTLQPSISLQVTNSAGCTNSVTLQATVQTVAAPPAVTIVAITLADSVLLICQNNTYTYQWGYDDKSDNSSHPADGEVYQSYLVAANSFDTLHKDYWVEICNSQGCCTKSYYNGVSSIDGVASKVHLNLFPNPASTSVRIESDNYFNRIEIFDLPGQVLQNKQFINPLTQTLLDLSILPAGVYLVKISYGEDLVITRKIIVQ